MKIFGSYVIYRYSPTTSSHWLLKLYREPLPPRYYRRKHLEVHCNNEKNPQHLALQKKEISKLPGLSFDRLQLTDRECTGIQRREFGHFVARKAILDEEYWVGLALFFNSNECVYTYICMHKYAPDCAICPLVRVYF